MRRSLLFMVYYVALLAEGVDRNNCTTYGRSGLLVSPSSRRAWIEIVQPGICDHQPESPSSRRAWIEITCWP